MAKRLANRLDPLTVKKLVGDPAKGKPPVPGRHPDGWNLYLVVDPSGAARWSFMYRSRVTGKRREMGLGSYHPEANGLAKARARAVEARGQLADELDPVTVKKTRQAVMTFGTLADEIMAKKEKDFRSTTAAARTKRALEHYCQPIRDIPVNKIGTEEVLSVLRPIWSAKAETARKVRGSIEEVLNAAKARGMRTGENPAAWRGHLDHILERKRPAPVKHHAAMNRDALPGFMAGLRSRDATAARALEFQVLCASRPGEVHNATWDEFDLDGGVWTIPAAKMKGERIHRVPLSARAVEIVREMKEFATSEYVFPGAKPGKPMTGPVFDRLMARMKVVGVTAHGFRSTFRDWATEVGGYPRELAEIALSHVVGDATERAYARGDALDRRRAMMEGWSKFCAGDGHA